MIKIIILVIQLEIPYSSTGNGKNVTHRFTSLSNNESQKEQYGYDKQTNLTTKPPQSIGKSKDYIFKENLSPKAIFTYMM